MQADDGRGGIRGVGDFDGQLGGEDGRPDWDLSRTGTKQVVEADQPVAERAGVEFDRRQRTVGSRRSVVIDEGVFRTGVAVDALPERARERSLDFVGTDIARAGLLAATLVQRDRRQCRVTAVDGRAAGEQLMSRGEAAVVLQRPQQRGPTNQVEALVLNRAADICCRGGRVSGDNRVLEIGFRRGVRLVDAARLVGGVVRDRNVCEVRVRRGLDAGTLSRSGRRGVSAERDVRQRQFGPSVANGSAKVGAVTAECGVGDDRRADVGQTAAQLGAVATDPEGIEPGRLLDVKAASI